MPILDDFDLCHDATFEDTGPGSTHRRSIEALLSCAAEVVSQTSGLTGLRTFTEGICFPLLMYSIVL